MCAAKVRKDRDENKESFKVRTSNQARIVYGNMTGVIMFDTYKAIKELEKEGKFSEKQAASIVNVFSQGMEHNIANLATKQDVELLRKDFEGLRKDTKQDIELLRKDLTHLEERFEGRIKAEISGVRTEIAGVRAEISEVRAEISTVHANLLKWVFGIAASMSTIMITAIYYMLKYLPIIQKAAV